MQLHFADRLATTVAHRGPLCLGLDPSTSLLDAWGLSNDAQGSEQFARVAIDAVGDVVGIVKCQVAFFERHGSAGYAALERVIAHAGAAGMLVIGDAKRGDIVSTNEGYAEAWLADASPLAVDAVTVSCYLGIAALEGLFALAHRTGRGVFAVVASSNDEGRALQTSTTPGGGSVESRLLAEISEINRTLDAGGPPTRTVGAVIGALRRPEGLAGFDAPVLVPGLGAQGGDAGDVDELRAALGHALVAVNVSRSVLGEGPSPAALRAAALQYTEKLRCPPAGSNTVGW
jgi:orotidine-5'-phosphate decarboxylase